MQSDKQKKENHDAVEDSSNGEKNEKRIIAVGGPRSDIDYKAEYEHYCEWFAASTDRKGEMLGLLWDPEHKVWIERTELPGGAMHFHAVEGLNRWITQSYYCDKRGISINTPTRWKERDDFEATVNKYRSKWGKERTGDVMEALYKRIQRYGFGYEVELWLAYFEGWDRKKANAESVPTFSADDIRSILSSLTDQEQNQFFTILDEYVARAEQRRSYGAVQAAPADDTGGDQKPVRQ